MIKRTKEEMKRHQLEIIRYENEKKEILRKEAESYKLMYERLRKFCKIKDD